MSKSTVILAVSAVLMFGTLGCNADTQCSKVVNFNKLGELAGKCNDAVKVNGRGALKTDKNCVETEKRNMKDGMVAIASMPQNTLGSCMAKYMNEFNKSQQNLEVWTQTVYR